MREGLSNSRQKPSKAESCVHHKGDEEMKRGLGFPISLIVFVMLSVSCSSYLKRLKDPHFVNFFEKAQLIMTEQEIEVYKRLLDEESKEEFIEEFWRIRDPDPGTDENEAKIEFEERIDYANRWFWPFSQAQGPDDEPDNDSGWNTDRGRMYIILGPPDSVYIGGFPYAPDDIHMRRSDPGGDEVWWYERYPLVLHFQRVERGDYRLLTDTADLMVAIESAKLNLVSSGLLKSAKRRFEFDVEYRDDKILIIIPVKRVDFKEENEKLTARFWVRINIYLEHGKVDEIEDMRDFSESEDVFIETKNIILEYPYELTAKGMYLFDVIVEDMMAMSFGKYRNSVKRKH